MTKGHRSPGPRWRGDRRPAHPCQDQLNHSRAAQNDPVYAWIDTDANYAGACMLQASQLLVLTPTRAAVTLPEHPI